MKFQPGDMVRYIEENDHSDLLETNKVYKVSHRCEFDIGVHLEGLGGEYDWWYDHRFELVELSKFYLITTCELQKFTKEELLIEIEKLNKSTYNPHYEVYKCNPVKVTVRSTIEIEE